MKSLSLYQENGTVLNKLHSDIKLLYAVAAILVPILISGFLSYACTIVISLILLACGRVLKKAAPVVSVSSVVLLTIVIIQGMFYSANSIEVFRIGPAVFYQEGLLYSLGIVLNVFNILLAICVLIFSTKPSDMIESFIERGFSPQIGYVFISIFQIIPQMAATMGTITDAQRSRGMEVEGSLMVRIKAFLPLISPVVMSSLADTKERAVALEVRGFNSKNKKVFLYEHKKTTLDKVLQILLFLAIIVTVIWRVVIWLGSK